MRRLFLCLPVCLLLTPATTQPRLHAAPKAVPDEAGLLRLAKTDPIAFLEACLARYERDVKGYRCVLKKQERLGGKLQTREVIEVRFREEPFAVYFNWLENARLAKRVLYVKGENNDKLLVKPSGLAAIVGIVTRDAEGPEAKKSGRYPLTEFGMKLGLERTIAAWSNARKENAFHIAYLGEIRVRELGDRPCYAFKRTRYRAPEEDGVTEYTTYIDKETLLQVGSVLKGDEGELVGEYLFADVVLNPEYGDDDFTRKGLSR